MATSSFKSTTRRPSDESSSTSSSSTSTANNAQGTTTNARGTTTTKSTTRRASLCVAGSDESSSTSSSSTSTANNAQGTTTNARGTTTNAHGTTTTKSTTRRASLCVAGSDESSPTSSSSTSTANNARGTTTNAHGTLINARGTTTTKSTTRRASLCADESSSATSTANNAQGTLINARGTTTKAHRRARSLSRFSPRPEYSTPKGKFVNMKRGSEFPDISLDDLAMEFFSSSQEKSGEDDERRSREVGRFARDTASSRRRGRSVSRQRDGGGSDAKSSISNGSSSRGRSISRQRDVGEVFRGSDGKGLVSNDSRGEVIEANLRRNRRRSLSVVRYQVSDSESDADRSQRSRHQGNVKNLYNKSQIATSVTQAAPNGRQLRRSLSQKDLSLYDYGHSRHSSASTDDDTRGSHMSKFATEKTIREVYSQNKIEHPTEDDSTGLYEAVRKELRQAVEEIRIEHQQAMGREKANMQLDKAEFDKVLTLIKQKCATMFKQSEKSKQDFPTKIKLEEQQARDLSKIIKEMVSVFKRSAASQKPGWTKKRSNDRNRLSKQLGEEAEKYFEDFSSNVEDTDISSFDGERSDASSTIGGTINEVDGTMRVEAQNYQSPARSTSHPTGTDGVILPWLQWETSNDSSLSGKTIGQPLRTSKALEWNVEPGILTLMHDLNSNLKSSIGSSSPGLFDVYLETTKTDDSKNNFQESGGCKRSQFDMEEYSHIQMKNEFLFERYKERHRIDFGGLLLCAGNL